MTSALPMEGLGLWDALPDRRRAHCGSRQSSGLLFQDGRPLILPRTRHAAAAGRGLSDHDLANTSPVTVINQTMAAKYFADRDPIGKRILVQQIVPGKTPTRPRDSLGNRRRGSG